MHMILKNLKSFSGALLMLTIMLIVLFWVLNLVATKAPAPVSTFAQTVETHANGSAY